MILEDVILQIMEPAKIFSDLLPKGMRFDESRMEYRSFLNKFKENAVPSTHPLLINISGLPASGKSFYIKGLLNHYREFVYISFDAIMESFDSYRKERLVNKKEAFERWELPARWMGYELMKICVAEKLSIIFEHSNSNIHHIELYKAIKSQGYKVEIRFIEAPPELVIPRLSLRDRYFPPEQVQERWEILQNIIPVYQNIVDSFIFLPPWREDAK